MVAIGLLASKSSPHIFPTSVGSKGIMVYPPKAEEIFG